MSTKLKHSKASKAFLDSLSDEDKRLYFENIHKYISNEAISRGTKEAWSRLSAEERSDRTKYMHTKEACIKSHTEESNALRSKSCSDFVNNMTQEERDAFYSYRKTSEYRDAMRELKIKRDWMIDGEGPYSLNSEGWKISGGNPYVYWSSIGEPNDFFYKPRGSQKIFHFTKIIV